MPLEAHIRTDIINAVKLGMPIPTAADLVGVTASSVRSEMSRDREFGRKVRQATAECMQGRLKALEKLENWQALAFILESLWPRRFGRKRRQMPKVIVRRLTSPKLDFGSITAREKHELKRILGKLHGQRQQRLLPDRSRS